MGTVDLTIQTFPMTINLVTPEARVNGHPVRVAPGTTAIPVPAGPVRVDVWLPWTGRTGEASLAFALGAGQRVPVFYAAPAHRFAPGAMGHRPVARRGRLAITLAMTAVVALVTLLAILPPLLR